MCRFRPQVKPLSFFILTPRKPIRCLSSKSSHWWLKIAPQVSLGCLGCAGCTFFSSPLSLLIILPSHSPLSLHQHGKAQDPNLQKHLTKTFLTMQHHAALCRSDSQAVPKPSPGPFSPHPSLFKPVQARYRPSNPSVHVVQTSAPSAPHWKMCGNLGGHGSHPA